MNTLSVILILYTVAINIIAVIATVVDKVNAKQHRRRIRESTLLLISAFGGSVAMLLTMNLIRHKTRHIKFMLGIPIIIIIQVFTAIMIWSYFYA